MYFIQIYVFSINKIIIEFSIIRQTPFHLLFFHDRWKKNFNELPPHNFLPQQIRANLPHQNILFDKILSFLSSLQIDHLQIFSVHQ